MKQKKVYLMVGIPGSGKSTWIKSQLEKTGGAWISRDEVRFSMVKENEEYFSKENDVFAQWIKNINIAIKDESIENIYVDATHISEASRNKTLLRLNLSNADVVPVVMATPLDLCIERNAQRSGRSCVPVSVIENMYKSFCSYPVHKDLAWKYKEILYIIEREVKNNG